jgi:hypothetical protein
MGILDSPALSPRAAASLYAPLTMRGAALRGFAVADNCYGTADGAVQTAIGTSRAPFTIAVACTDLRLMYGNWGNNGASTSPNFYDVDGPGAITIKASVEIAGTIYRATFNGSITATIDPGGMIGTDPLPVDITAGTIIYVRTYITHGGAGWRFTRGSYQSAGSGGWVTTTDLTAPGSAAIADSVNYLFAPMAITGTPAPGTSAKSTLVVGDSIAAGLGDSASMAGWNVSNSGLSGGGYISRGLHGLAGFVNVAVSGDRAYVFAANTGHFRRLMLGSSFSNMICEYGRNDLSDGRTLAQIQASQLAIWRMGVARGMRVFQTTITPRTTSTDGWCTVQNQTADTTAIEAVRTGLNDWLRAGAPLVGGNPAAVGTAGAVLAGQAGHPLYGYFEAADLAESARNSGLWGVNSGRAFTGAAITSGTAILTSATGNFTSADIGQTAFVAGAGSSGGNLITGIASVQSSTQITLTSNAGTTVSNANASIGKPRTADGTHPYAHGANVMSAAIDTTKLL